jgi:hypothetical protein
MRPDDMWLLGALAAIVLTTVAASRFADAARRDGARVMTTRQRLTVPSLPLGSAIRATSDDNLALLVQLLRPQRSRAADGWRALTWVGAALEAGVMLMGPPRVTGDGAAQWAIGLTVAGLAGAAFWAWQAALGLRGVTPIWWRIASFFGFVAALAVIVASARLRL